MMKVTDELAGSQLAQIAVNRMELLMALCLWVVT